MTKPEQIDDTQLIELIQSKATAENVDSGWMVALVLMNMMPTLKEIANNLRRLESAIAVETDRSVSEKLGSLGWLREIAHALRKPEAK